MSGPGEPESPEAPDALDERRRRRSLERAFVVGDGFNQGPVHPSHQGLVVSDERCDGAPKRIVNYGFLWNSSNWVTRAST